MEVNLKEKVSTQVKLCISKFTKDYLEKTAMVEVVKCVVNTETGEIIKKEFVQNRVFRNRMVHSPSQAAVEVKDFDQLLENINKMGEAAYFEKLLGMILNGQ